MVVIGVAARSKDAAEPDPLVLYMLAGRGEMEQAEGTDAAPKLEIVRRMQ